MSKMLLLAMLLSIATTAGCKEKMYSPKNYFDGQYLKAARLIDEDNELQFKAILPALKVDAPGREQMTLLWYAIVHKKYDAIRDLIAAGSQPDEQGVEGLGSALYFALTSDDTRLLQAMLDGGLSPDFQDSDGSNLLQRSIIGERGFDRVRLLVERGANINLRDSLGDTALNEAIDSLEPKIAIYLIQHGANVTGRDVNGFSTAWAVQSTIDQFDPQAKRETTITNYSIDDSGKLVSTTEIPPPLGASPRGRELWEQFKQLRQLMIEKGAKFPPDPPAKVREQMQEQGTRPPSA